MNLSEIIFLTIRGYILTILIETPILFWGLSSRHTSRDRLFAGVWLTACSYPVVALVIPRFIDPYDHRTLYLIVAEIFAPLSECLLFWLAFREDSEIARKSMLRDLSVVVLANICSFSLGEVLYALKII